MPSYQPVNEVLDTSYIQATAQREAPSQTVVAVHAASKRVRDDLRAAYFAFFAAFREAAEQLRAGVLPAVFPAGSFPPALPFVGG